MDLTSLSSNLRNLRNLRITSYIITVVSARTEGAAKMSRRTVALCGVLLMATGAAAGPRAMTVDDLFRFQRVADPQISPNGDLVVYAVTTVVDAANNKTQSNL